jgi:hypothetical protein
VLRCPRSYRAEREYVTGVVLGRFLDLDHRVEPAEIGHVEITLEGDSTDGTLLLPDLLFSTPEGDWLAPGCVPAPPLPRWEPGSEFAELGNTAALPVLLGDPPAPVFVEGDAGARLELDVLGTAFMLLTRLEEVARPAVDEHGRYRFTSSLAYQDGFLQRPLVDEYVEVLDAALRRVWPGLPERRPSPCVLMTHDVDFPFAGRQSRRAILRSTAADLVKRREPNLARARLRTLVDRGRHPERDPAFTFDFILEENERHGVPCLLNFMTETGGFGSSPYSLNEPWARTLLRRVAAGDHELGLHPSYRSHTDPSVLAEQFDRLRVAAGREGIEQERWGGRQHWLCWENPVTWRAWEEAGLDFDSSLGYDEVPGFRAGTCRAYPAFDLVERRRLALEERPLLWMDVTYMNYLGMTPMNAVAQAAEIWEVCRRHGGEFTILWHNDSLASRDQQAAYRALLDHLF